MSADKENLVVDNAQSTQKRNRRGVSNSTKAVANLRFHEKDASPQNMLFVGHLAEIKLDWSKSSESKSFTGESVPYITLHFTSEHTRPNEQRHVYQSINCVESNVNTIPGGSEEWRVNNVFNWIKHILDVYYLKGREMTEAEELALSLPFEDFNDEGEYIPVDTKDVLNGYYFIFNNFLAMLNGSFNLAEGETAKPCYKTADGKFIPAWLKLLRHKKVRNEWKNVAPNGELGFDQFIGNGVIELIRKDMPPAVLRVDLSKESITPKEVKKVPTMGGIASNMPMGGVIPGSPMDMGSPINSAFADASSDMPF